jgi:hypothetical protein
MGDRRISKFGAAAVASTATQLAVTFVPVVAPLRSTAQKKTGVSAGNSVTESPSRLVDNVALAIIGRDAFTENATLFAGCSSFPG